MARTTVLEEVIKWLNDLVPGYPASNQMPKTLGKRFILAQRDGGRRRNMVLDMADILITVYDKESALDCANIADFIADKVPGLVLENDDITHSEVVSIFEANDLDRQYYRYEITCSVYMRKS